MGLSNYGSLIMASLARFNLRHLRPHVLILAALGLEVVACGGDVGYILPDGSGSGGGSGGDVPWSVGGTASGGNPFYGSGGLVEDGSGGVPPYEEEECPEIPPPVTLHECDPLDARATCPDDQSCMPYIQYPNRDDGCGSPGYGELCWYAGEGAQGELCTSVGTGCAPGLMCVVGAAGGERCAQICVPGEPGTCPYGLICGETDVLGYGVCY